MIRGLAAIAVACAAGVAFADPEVDADRAFQAAEARVAAGDPGALDALEALGAERPVTRWTDDAWLEAGRLAERAGDLARARRDLAQAIATGSDPRLVDRARAALHRLETDTGGGRWDQVAADHDRLANALAQASDPKPVLHDFEALIANNPGYPRATVAQLAIAEAWERDGNFDRALDTLAEAAARPGRDQSFARATYARALIRHDRLGAAADQIAAFAESSGDRALASDLRRALATARHRAWLRRGLWLLLALLAATSAITLRRDAGSWRAGLRSLARPPAEVLFLLPIGLVLAVVAATGNPLIARVVWELVAAGLAIAWLSGTLLDVARAKHGAIRARRMIAHCLLALAAVGSIAYLAVEHDRMIDIIVETWHAGPERP